LRTLDEARLINNNGFPQIFPDYIRQKLKGLEDEIAEENSQMAEALEKYFKAKVEVDRYEFQTTLSLSPQISS
tara:strand:- start:530 stop:748 length:219 start_codon:yes stop_codon:yes gene_type:complete